MSWLTRCSVWLLVGFGLVLSPLAFAQDAGKKDDKAKGENKDEKKKSDEKDKKDKKDDKNKPVFIGSLAGKVSKIINDDEGATLYLEIVTVTPQLQLYSRRPVTGYSLLRRNMMTGRDYRGYLIPQEKKQDMEVPINEDTKIRIPPKPEVDEKGKIVKKPELKRDKKDPEYGLPGVKGAITDLNRGQIVRVSLGQMKDPNDPKKVVIVTMMIEMLGDPSEMQQQGQGRP